jgi:hypothetical protein
MLAHMSDEVRSSFLDRRVDITLNALQQIARFLSSVPGRKNLIWISGSFPASVSPDAAGSLAPDTQRMYNQQIVDADDLLCTSQVAVYPVDARGLVAPILTSGPQTLSGPSPAQAYAARLAAEHGTLRQIADDTGGTAYYNTNGLAQAFQSALDNGRNYYSLTYAPTNPNFNGQLRRIRLTVDHRGYRLAYRRYYYADNLDEGRKDTEADSLADAQPGSLLSALEFGAPEAHELIFAARVNAVGSPVAASPEQMTKLMPCLRNAALADGVNFEMPKRPVKIQHFRIGFGVMGSELTLLKGNDGMYHPELTFAVMAYDAQGNALGGKETTLNAAIPAAKLDEAEKLGYQAIENVYVPAAAASLRVAVRDGRSSRIGSLEISLPLAPAATAKNGEAGQ